MIASAAVNAIERRLDRLALEQLRVVAARLAEENDQLRRQLAYAESAAESWREDALKLMEDACAAGRSEPGLTQNGHLVLVPCSEASA